MTGLGMPKQMRDPSRHAHWMAGFFAFMLFIVAVSIVLERLPGGHT